MAVRKKYSKWRDIYWQRHGNVLCEQIREEFIDSAFNIQMVTKLPALQHLTDRTAYDIATAICQQLYVNGVIQRQGEYMHILK